MRPPPPVAAAAQAWQAAREAGDPAAEELARTRIVAQGWQIGPTAAGYALEPRPPVTLAEHTTLRLGGPVRQLVRAETETDLVDVVRDADVRGEPLLVLGGGSNLVVADAGFDGLVVQVATTGLTRDGDDVTIAAGEVWDDVVTDLVGEGRAGVEALSGIPGLVGATPIQNVGAYGQEVAQTITAVRVFDRRSGEVRVMTPEQCKFTYRHSVFKGDDTHVVLAVTFSLPHSTIGTPVRYAALAAHLGVDVGAAVPAAEVRAAVLDMRRAKGMVLDPADHDTWSAGSFFTNPMLAPNDADRLPADAPRWPQADGRVKTSAAWLIEQAGFTKGYGDGRARVSTKHTLALTNCGGATTDELLALAREIRDGVRDRFGVTLVNEPVLLGMSL